MTKYIAPEFLLAPILIGIGIFIIPFVVWVIYDPEPDPDRLWAEPPLPAAAATPDTVEE